MQMGTAGPYRFGIRSEETRALQEALIAHGLSVGDDGADGIFGSHTTAAVAHFQAEQHMVPTGYPDPATLAALLPKRASPLSGWLSRLVVSQALKQIKDSQMLNFLAGYKTYIIALVMVLIGVAELLGIPIPGVSNTDPTYWFTTAVGLFFARAGAKNDLKNF